MNFIRLKIYKTANDITLKISDRNELALESCFYYF